MFEKINQLVKENIKNEVFINAGLNANVIEAVSHEASGVIIDVMKSHLDNGKAKDLMSFFKGKKSEHDLLVGMMMKKFANKLNKYHGLNNSISYDIAESIIPSVMKKLVTSTSDDKKEEKGIFALFNWLSGYSVNFEEFFLKINKLQTV
jgi:hypothetical protein